MFRSLGSLCMALYQLTKIKIFSDMATALHRMGRVGDAAQNVRRNTHTPQRHQQQQREQDRSRSNP